MNAEEKTGGNEKRQLAYTHLGCPLTRNRTAWCFRLCAPDDDGNGRCGRIAPYHLKGRTQLSIERYNESDLNRSDGRG
jgi:hypothetical protein